MSRNAVNKRQNRGSGRQRLSVGALDNLHARLGALSEDVGAAFDPVGEPVEPPHGRGTDSILEIVLAGCSLICVAGFIQIYI